MACSSCYVRKCKGCRFKPRKVAIAYFYALVAFSMVIFIIVQWPR